MKVHIADSCRSAKWRQFEVNWKAFVTDKLSKPIRTGETYQVYKSLDKDEKSVYKDCGGYLFGVLAKDSRAKVNVISRNALLLDLDFAPIDAWDSISRTYELEMALHSTHSHSTETPRFRLIVPLNRECTPDEYECVARTFAYYLNIEWFDKTTFQRNRLMYFPSVSQDGEWVFEHKEGVFLDVDLVLSTYVDWRDMTTWPYHSGEKVHDGSGQKRQNPLEQGGIIGAFNRAYPMNVLLENVLGEVYTHNFGDRYTYIKGSSSMGAVTYDNMWFYSYHATDPAQGRLLNAFELFACHLFDDDFKKALEAASNLPEVRKTLVLGAFQSMGEDFKPTEVDLSATWYGELEIGKDGKIAQTDRNINLIFENDPNLKGVFKYNEFVNNIYLSRPTAWRDNVPVQGDTIRNVDYPLVRKYLGLKYGFTNRSMIEETMMSIAYANKYHPIRDFLCSLTWDGLPRIETALIDYFGADDNSYTRAVFKKTLIGAISRAFSPGSKHDTVLILVGLEGSCKSLFWKRLGMDWHSDTFDMHQDKAMFEQLQGKWIIEIAEFDKLSRADVGQVKYFVTKASDTYRPAFGHVVEDFPRQFILTGSTNEDGFLKSETGNRRFNPVRVANGMYERGLHVSSKYVYTDLDMYEVTQMWAEAFECFLSGETNVLDRDETVIADVVREEYEEQSAITGEIDQKLLTLVPANYDTMTSEEVQKWWNFPDLRAAGTEYMQYVTGVQIWVELLGRSRESYGKLQQLEMTSAIRKSQHIDSTSSSRVHTSRYGRQRCYKVKI